MQLTIFSCSPQGKERSTSAFVANAFKIGFTANHLNSANIYYLNRRDEWKEQKEHFINSANVLFVLPLYVDCVPGLLQEFLEYISDWGEDCQVKEKKQIAFIVQSGFPEASQMRTCEAYLEQLPARLGCDYAGTLLKGSMFGKAYAFGEKEKEKTGNLFVEWGMKFAKKPYFDKKEVTDFSTPEHFNNVTIAMFRLFSPLNRLVWYSLAKKNGVKGHLHERPYKII